MFDDGYEYIGQAKDLNNRLGNYRRPCAGVDVENVMHLLLLDANQNKIRVTVETFITQDRHVLERQEINDAILRGKKILNSEGLGYRKYVEFKIKYYNRVLEASKGELERMISTS